MTNLRASMLINSGICTMWQMACSTLQTSDSMERFTQFQGCMATTLMVKAGQEKLAPTHHQWRFSHV